MHEGVGLAQQAHIEVGAVPREPSDADGPLQKTSGGSVNAGLRVLRRARAPCEERRSSGSGRDVHNLVVVRWLTRCCCCCCS